MKFYINYQDNNTKAKRPITSVGIKAIDRARAFLGLPELDVSLFFDSYGKSIENYIIVPESIVRASGKFDERGQITVYVPHYGMYQFCDETYALNKNEKTGEIKSVQLVWTLNSDKFLEFWADNCYFTSWEIDDEENVFDCSPL